MNTPLMGTDNRIKITMRIVGTPNKQYEVYDLTSDAFASTPLFSGSLEQVKVYVEGYLDAMNTLRG